MLPYEALKDMRPLVLTPAYGGLVQASYTRSVIGLTNAAWAAGMTFHINVGNGSSLVTRARNEMLVDFLADTQFTHLIWIDADIGFAPESCLQLLRRDLDVVAAAYPAKAFGWPVRVPAGQEALSHADFMREALRYPVNSGIDAGLPRTPDESGLLEVTEAPTGFMCIKRAVFDRMIEHYAHLRYVPDGIWSPEKAALCYRFFDTMLEPETQRYLSEDYAFCRRWRDIGGRVFIDASIQLGHTGNYEFRGSFADALQARPGRAMGGGYL